jgi:hypothetical protein
MTHILRCVAIAMLLSQSVLAAPQRKRVSLTSPSVTQTVPQDYVDSMNRQEERLDDINSRMVAMDTSLKDFKEDTQRTLGKIDSKLGDMSTTNVAMKFVLAIVIVVIPTLLGVWFTDFLKRRRPAVP